MLYVYFKYFIISNLIFGLNIILIVFGEFYKLSFIIIIKLIIGIYNIIYIIKFNFYLGFLSRIHLKCICCFRRENNYFQLN